MFVDDDIVPQNNFVAQVINFHNAYPSEKCFGTGKVTWKGTPFENSITNWFEEWGGWSILKTISTGSHLAHFSGGFTSFQTSIREQILFSEKFTRYGCEDIEFGIRLKALGGEVRGNAQLIGLHHCTMNASIYARNHRGAGYSQGTMFRLHPDSAFPLPHFERNVRLHSMPDEAETLAKLVNQLTCNPIIEGEEIHSYMQLLTEAAIGEGHIEHEIETYPGFSEAMRYLLAGNSERLSRLQGATKTCPSHPLLWMLRAREEKKQNISEIDSLWRAANCLEHYVAPLLELDSLCDPEARTRLEEIFQTQQHVMDPKTFKAVAARLGGAVLEREDRTTQVNDLFHEMLQFANQASETAEDSAIGLGLAILSKEIGHVGAALGLAELLQKRSPIQSTVFANMAEYFLKFRPGREHLSIHQRLYDLNQKRKIEQ